ncbi:MAG: DUF4344 domain-containing metallopeptidase [Pseudomonadota bacterium]
MIRAVAFALALLPGPLWAQDHAEEDFVSANVLSIFYHEFGHALIDILQLPVFGQEEDAADVASILLIDGLFEETGAQAIARDAALGFAAEAELYDGEETAWWSEHGPDLQRFYNLVCLFYGANPEARDDFAQDMGLPAERADTCPEEFDLAYDSWGPVFDELTDGSHARHIDFEAANESLLARTVAEEVSALNKELRLPDRLRVTVESCGAANAFYDLDAKQIIMCTEFESHLRDLFALSR